MNFGTANTRLKKSYRTLVYYLYECTCAHFGRDQICTQVKASFLPFGHPTQVNASWVTSINLLLANEIQDMSALKCFFILRLACTCEETCQCVWPPNASLYASSTCAHLRLLAGPFDQGLMFSRSSKYTKQGQWKHFYFILWFSDRINRMKGSYGNFFIQSQSRDDFPTRGKSVSSNRKSAVKVCNVFTLLLVIFIHRIL